MEENKEGAEVQGTKAPSVGRTVKTLVESGTKLLTAGVIDEKALEKLKEIAKGALLKDAGI